MYLHHISCSGFTCGNQQNNGQTCVSVVTSGQSAALASCSAGTTVGLTTITPPITATLTDSSSVSIATYTSYTIFAPMIEIRRQATDALPSSTASATPTTSETTQSSSSSSGLSTGAKAAIGVVVPVVVLAILLAAFLIWRRRRARRTADTAAQQAGLLHYSDAKPPVEASTQPISPAAPKTPYAEMNATREPQEMMADLPADYERQELPGEPRSA